MSASAGEISRRAASGSDPATRPPLPYVLVADSDIRRAATCLDAIAPFRLGVLIARDGDEAFTILQRFGAPILLVTELSLPRRDGLSLIEALRARDGGRTEVIAWSAFRELREFASHRWTRLNLAAVLPAAASPAQLKEALDRALNKGAGSPAAPGSPDLRMATRYRIDQLADRARQLCGAPGVAVYVKAPDETQFRARVQWTSSAPTPHSPFYVPRVFEWVAQSGDALILPDLATQPLAAMPTSTLQDVVRGLVAVPIVVDDRIVGTICVFDVKPLTIGAAEVDALKALGRRVTSDRAAAMEQRGSSLAAGMIVPILNRSEGDDAVRREQARARREQSQLSLILFGVETVVRSDRVRAAADAEVAEVADTLSKTVRGTDLAIRWSREELLLVLPGLGADEARHVAERVRAALHARADHQVAIVDAVAELRADEPLETAFKRADEKLKRLRDRRPNRAG